MKFTKGKDLSSWSETDLDCIFGKRRNKKLAQDGCSSSTADDMDTPLTTTTTTTSAFTIQEYFAKRMAHLKSKPQASAPDSDLSETPVEWKKGKKNKEAADPDVENSPQHKAKWHKKKKQMEAERGPVAKKRDQAEQQPGGPSGDEGSDTSVEAAEDYIQTPDSQDDARKPKKRKAKKKLQRQEG